MKIPIVGPSYRSQSVNADAQKTLNMYVERDESGAGKSEFQLYPTPGLSLFSAVGTGPIRSILNANQRCFCVSGDSLYEVFGDGTNSLIGVVGDDGDPASMCNSATQLAVVSNGQLYVYDLSTNTWVGAVATGIGAVKMVAYSDGYFICLISDSQKFQISSLLDATTWDPTDVTQVSVFPDNVLSILVDHREIFCFGVTKSVVYGNTGAADFPYSPIPSSYIEQGIAAAWCRDRLDNSVFWLGSDDRGQLMAWRAQGYTPARISNHAVENEWQNYVDASDAISYSYQDRGHTFWQIYFPTANTTWTYDVATGMWHQRSYLNNGAEEAHLSRCHTFVFNQHLVGDRRNGNVYVMNINIPDDDGYPIQRLRRSPHYSKEQVWLYGSQLQIDAEVGQSTVPLLLDGVTQRTLLAGAGNALGAWGQIYCIVIAILSDGSRLQSPILGPYSNGDTIYAEITVPTTANVISWRFVYSDTLDGPAYFLTFANLAYIGIGAGSIALGSTSGSPPITAAQWLANSVSSINWVAGLSGNGSPRNPILWLSWSNDGGHNYSNQIPLYLGLPGEYAYRSITYRLGRWRDRVWQLEYSDLAFLRIVDAYLQGPKL